MTFHQAFILAMVPLLSLFGPISVSGQDAVQGGSHVGGVEDSPAAPQGSHRSWWSLWSAASSHDRIFLGMWTFHPFGDDPFLPESNNGLGLQYGGVFGFTCVNSFARRTYAVGVERIWFEAQRGRFGVMLGYRAGLIHGYDTELLRVEGETPILPFAGTVALLRLGPVGGEVSWVYQAVSLVGAVFF